LRKQGKNQLRSTTAWRLQTSAWPTCRYRADSYRNAWAKVRIRYVIPPSF
jgi:hypothetical protein